MFQKCIFTVFRKTTIYSSINHDSALIDFSIQLEKPPVSSLCEYSARTLTR